MSEPTALSGPDLAAGVPVAALQEAVPFLGHAAGEPVILVKRGTTVLSLGATCPHYGGPLAEGLVVGDTIRCPWHHACFDLRTGEATGAPALSDVPAFAVTRATATSGWATSGRGGPGGSPGRGPRPSWCWARAPPARRRWRCCAARATTGR